MIKYFVPYDLIIINDSGIQFQLNCRNFQATKIFVDKRNTENIDRN